MSAKGLRLMGGTSRPGGTDASKYSRTKSANWFLDQTPRANPISSMQRCVLLVIGGASRGVMAELAATRGWTVVKALEVPRSEVRRGLEGLRQAMHQGLFEAVIVDTVKIPGLSTNSVLRELEVMVELRIALRSVREPWLSTLDDQGQLISWLVANLDREHSENIRASLAKVRAEGRSIGRPRALIPTEQVLEMRASGASLRVMAKATGLGAATLHRFLRAHDQVAKAGKSKR